MGTKLVCKGLRKEVELELVCERWLARVGSEKEMVTEQEEGKNEGYKERSL